jgi:hypothetical protein
VKTRVIALSLALLAGLSPGPHKHRLPRFSDYPVKDIYRGTPAKPKLNHNREARMYRTVLSDGVTEGANFAGHYTYVDWGCGTDCQKMAIVNIETGDVFMYPVPGPTGNGALYRLNSRLLITDPIDSTMEGFPRDMWPTTYYWTWDGTRLHLIDSSEVLIGPDSTL